MLRSARTKASPRDMVAHARASKHEGGPAVVAASCFETHRSAIVFVEANVRACAAMLLTRPSDSELVITAPAADGPA